MKTEDPIYIYALVDPRTHVVRYVGRSIMPDERLKAHCLASSRQHAVRRWIEELAENGHRPELMILDSVYDTRTAHNREAEMITVHAESGQLLNVMRLLRRERRFA